MLLGSSSHVTLNCLHLGVYYIHSMIVWCSLLFDIIPFIPFCTSPVAYSIVILLLVVNRLPSKIRAGFPLVVVMNSMVVDCNEMISIVANPPYFTILDLSINLTYNILYSNWCKFINALDQ